MTVLLETKGGSLRLVGTDRHRLAIRDLVPRFLHTETAIVLPATALHRWLEGLDRAEAGDMTITVEHGHVALSDSMQELRAAIIPTTYPPYEALLTQTADATIAVVPTADVLYALESFGGREAVRMRATTSGFSIERDGTQRNRP